MSKPRETSDPEITRSAAVTKKEVWDRYTTLIVDYFKGLEAWVKDRAYVNLDTLTRSLQGNLEDPDRLWAAMEALQTVATDQLTYKQKLANIDKILSSMEDEVMSAPAALKPSDKDTFQERDFQVCTQRTKQEESLDVYTAWEARFKRSKAEYDAHANLDGTPKMEPDEPRRGQRRD